MEPDTYLLARVQDALASDERTNELGVDVRIAAGALHLKGSVPTAQRREAIGLVAAEASDGMPVVNDVTVPELPEPSVAEELG